MEKKYFYYLIFIILFILLIDIFITRNLKTCNINNFILHNDVCTLNKKTHLNIVKLIPLNYKKHNNILEIGAGNGNSSVNIINYLNSNNISFDYTIVEIDKDYYKNLKKIENNYNCKYINKSWTELKNNYDIIISTAFSSVNDENYNYFKNVLCNKDTIIVTILSVFKISKIKKYGFKLIDYKRISPLFYTLYLKV